MARTKGSKNCSTAPGSIEQARKMARIKAIDAAPLWGLPANTMRVRCIRGEVKGAVKLGQIWYVTPLGMDLMFEQKKRRA